MYREFLKFKAYSERLRVDGKLTNCETGNRLIISKTLKNQSPRKLQIGKYWALVFTGERYRDRQFSRTLNVN
jgi:hypothetical protein